jgi:hypothetical protein
MASNESKRVRLEVESLENRLVPTIGLVQQTGGVLDIRGLDTPELVHIAAKGNKIIVELTDLSNGLSVTVTFKKDKVHNVRFDEGVGDKDIFIDDFHDRHVHTQSFNHEGAEIGDDHGGESGGSGETSGHH